MINHQSQFSLYQNQITSSARVSQHSLESLGSAFEDLREKLSEEGEDDEGGSLKDVAPGDEVLVFVRGHEEWCRATFLRHVRDEVVQVSFTDYGHNGEAFIKDLRAMKERTRLEPVQVREFIYKMPETNQVRGF